jgi:hypothetical protein
MYWFISFNGYIIHKNNIFFALKRLRGKVPIHAGNLSILCDHRKQSFLRKKLFLKAFYYLVFLIFYLYECLRY